MLRWKTLLCAAVAAVFVSACAGSTPSALAPAKTVADPSSAYRTDIKAAAADAGVAFYASMGAMGHKTTQVLVTVNGTPVKVPTGIGVAGMAAAALHTHAGDGLVSMDDSSTFTLDQFLTLWGVAPTSDGMCQGFAKSPSCTVVVKTNNMGATVSGSGWVQADRGFNTQLADRHAIWIDITN